MSSPPRRPTLAVLGVLLAAALLALVLPGSRSRDTRAQATVAATAATPTGCAFRASPQVRRGPRTGRRIALTFDDGPSALTASFLRVLEHEHVPATFFVVGREVAARAALLRRVLHDGGMIGNHSFTHTSLAAADDAAVREIEDTQRAVRDATGFTPCLLRPPYGLSSRALVARLAERRLTSVLWSVNPQDFTRPGTAVVRRRVLADAAPGAIVLLHDGGGDRRQTLAALPGMVHALRARGYRFVTVTNLLGLRTSP